MRFSAVLILAAGVYCGAVLADAPLLSLKPEQAARAGLQTRPLAELKDGGEYLLPAQVVIDPRRLEILAAPLAGIVTRIAVLSGEYVKKGQLLGQLRGAQLLELQRDFLAARAQAETADEARRRDEALFNDGIIPRSRLSQTLSIQRQAAAALAEKKQSLSLAGLGDPGDNSSGVTGLVSLRAPFDGVVLESPVQPGQRVESNTLLFKLGALDSLALEMQAGPTLAGSIHPGDAIVLDGCPRAGKVTVVAPSLTGASQSILVRGELVNPAGCVRPFQQLQVRVRPGRKAKQSGWIIPREALVRQEGQTWVFVAVDKGFQPHPVTLVEEFEHGLRIEGDLAAKTEIVVKGVSALKAVWLGLGSGG